MIGSMTESFPRQQARTRRFTLGVPRAFEVSPDGARVTFLRSRAGDDPVTCRGRPDAATGRGADRRRPARARRRRGEPAAGGAGTARAGQGDPPPESWPTPPTPAATLAVFALSGQVYMVPLGATFATGGHAACPAAAGGHPALDPRIDPTGTKVGYVHDGALRVIDLESGQDAGDRPRRRASPSACPEFVAAEEMDRSRGYWWSPDGRQLLVARVDESPVAPLAHRRPGQPGHGPPSRCAYPAAGTAERRRVPAGRHAPGGRRDPGGRRAQRPHPARRRRAGLRAAHRGGPGTGLPSPTWSTRPGATTC